VEVVWLTFQHLGDTALLTQMVDGEPLVDRLVATMNAVPRSPSGLVFIDPALPWDRCPYGFTDTVRKQGEVLFCSLLDVQASWQLADLLEAVGRSADAATWRDVADTAAAAIRSTFWDPDVGLFRAATVQCREHDIWGSAFAVHLEVATEAQADKVAEYFRDNYDDIVQAGQVRHLPGGTYWEVAGTQDSYQNGGYWPVATGWFAKTLSRVDQQLADHTFVAMVNDFKARGVNEWVIGATVGVPFYTASATVPLGIMNELYQIPPTPRPVQIGGSMEPDNLALASNGATAFAKDVITGHAQHSIAHLNDGLYGNNNSWIAASGESFAGIAFAEATTIAAVAFGRDNGGEATQFIDRYEGSYILQFTRSASPGPFTPDEEWITVAYCFLSRSYPDTTGYLRHRYAFEPIDNVTGIRLLVSATHREICIDELEVYGSGAVSPVLFVDGGFEAPGMSMVPAASPGVLDVTGTRNGVWIFGGSVPGALITLLSGDWLGVNLAGAANPPADAFEGDQWISFNGGGSTAGGTAIQLFSTTPGQLYELEFSIAYGSLSEDADHRILAEALGAAGVLGSLSQAAMKNQWTTHSIRFVADDTTTTLRFTDKLQSGGGSSDLFLDAVSVTLLSALSLQLDLIESGDLRFTWNAEPGKIYNLLSSTNLQAPPLTWAPFATDLVTSPYEVEPPSDRARFFVLVEKASP
jgi:hypothetical protein